MQKPQARLMVIAAMPEKIRHNPDVPPLDHLDYVAPGDFENTGLACVAAYCNLTGPRVFMLNNLDELSESLTHADLVIGHDLNAFDIPLLDANGITVDLAKLFDIRQEIATAASRDYGDTSLELSNIAEANLRMGLKLMDIARYTAMPFEWQHGRSGLVADHALQRVWACTQLAEKIGFNQELNDPQIKGDKLKFTYSNEIQNILGELPAALPLY